MEITGIKFQQEGINLFICAMSVEVLLRLQRVDVFDASGPNATGYQRAPELPRARAFARYLQTQNLPLAPTSVLINVREGLNIVNDGRSDVLILDDDTDLWIMDGQHRLAGFRYAVEQDGVNRLSGYELPVVITDGLDEAQEAEQFRVINETSKKVRTDLARRLLDITATSRSGRAQLRAQRREWEAKAANIAHTMNTDPASPLYARIQAPNDKKTASHTVRELSFETSLRPILTTLPYEFYTPDDIASQLSSYWHAWKAVVPEAFDHPQEHVLLKTAGVFSLHRVAVFMWEYIRSTDGKPDQDTVGTILSSLTDAATSEYWHSENINGAAIYGSMKGFAILADLIQGDLRDLGYTIGS